MIVQMKKGPIPRELWGSGDRHNHIELVQGYRPDAWNPYPAIKPTVSGFYLLTVKLKDQPNVKPFVTIGCLDPFGYWEKYTDSEVLAFRELPEAYEKEKEK